MVSCEQTSGINQLQHGLMVAQKFTDLYSYLKGGKLPDGWVLPTWIDENRELILTNLLPLDTILDYVIYHDCGKPFCETIDEEGKRHFPDHAFISKATAETMGLDPQVCKLIGMDMDAHLLKAENIEEFANRPEAITLLVVALCEIHANCSMFGGTDSTSFKIKFKHLEKRGKQVFNSLKIKSTQNGNNN